MTRPLVVVLCRAAVVMLGGCLPNEPIGSWPGSLYPIYTSSQDVVTEPVLLGEWRDMSDPSSPKKWYFEKTDEAGAYRLGIISGGEQSAWKARLVKGGDLSFLDVLKVDASQKETGDTVFDLQVSLHAFLRVQKEGDSLRLSCFNWNWYLRQLEAKQFPLKVERLGDDVPVITSPSEEVRAYFAKAAAQPEAFIEVAALQRYRPPAAGKQPEQVH